jgi:hypothetical protein
MIITWRDARDFWRIALSIDAIVGVIMLWVFR